jgi:nucleoside-diphosphate-sugar epimerase
MLMKILVTGHLGYVGTVLTPLLRKAGHEVFGCDSGLFEQGAFSLGAFAEPVPLLADDVRMITAADLRAVDAIVHLAALSGDRLADARADTAYGINHLCAVHLAVAARQAGVSRFLMASTCSNYGQDGDEIIDRTGELASPRPYVQSKLWAERDLAPLADSVFCPVMLRLASVFGLSPRMRLDTVLNNMAARAVMTGLISLKSDGTSWRPVVHVEDACRAFLTALDAPMEQVSAKTFNIGNDAHNYRLRDLAQIVADTVPCCRLEFAPEEGVDERSFRVSFQSTERGLSGFRAHWDARRGAEQLCEAYSAAGLTTEHLEGARFDRAGLIDAMIAAGELAPDLRRMRTAGAQLTAMAS